MLFFQVHIACEFILCRSLLSLLLLLLLSLFLLTLILFSFAFSVDRASFSPAVFDFVSAPQVISAKECMDANLESKICQHGVKNALEWLRIFHNLGK